jgi:hypothetical protein
MIPLYWSDYQRYLAMARIRRTRPLGWTVYNSLRTSGYNPMEHLL